MSKKLTDEFNPIDLEDFIKALNAVPEEGQIEFSELMKYFQSKNGGKPMYLDIPSYIHDTRWPLIFSGKLVSHDGKAVSDIDDLLYSQFFWMLCIYESNHKSQNSVIPLTFSYQHLM